jgi:NAD-dependent SIR2 family protein deacetylase
MSKHIVYFLGAGCSKNFGYPLTGEIMPLIMEKLLKGDLFQISETRKTAKERGYEKELLGFLYMFYPGLRRLNIKDEKQKEQIPGITEVLSLIDHFCFYNLPPHPRMADAQLVRFRELLNRAVVELILEYDLRTMDKSEEELFYKFIQPINREKTTNKVSIITTNYDMLIDWEFSNLAAANKIDYGISYRDVDNSKIIFRDPKPRFHYYKLHGSLNWLRCDLCGHYYINPDGTIVGLAFTDKADDFNTCVCSNTLRLKSVLVAPSIVRDIRDANLLQIWKASMEAIRTADQLIFIGYSLPGEDLAIKSVIMRGLNGRNKKQALKVDVVQHGSTAQANYLNLFGNKINYYPGGLKQYLR